MKSLSYKSLRNTGLGMVFKSVMMVILLSVVTLPNLGGAVKPTVTSQYVLFEVEPKNALVEFDGSVITLNDGTATKRMQFGTYFYKVSAPLYHSQESSVEVNDPVNKHVVKVTLAPAFGYITVPATGTLSGASVFVNNEFKGRTPYNSGPIASGVYEVRVVKDMYEPMYGQVTVTDNQTTTFSHELKADFANVTLSVGNQAEIWINNVYKGSGMWKGPLASGSYMVECKKQYHTPTSREVVISPEMAGQTISLESPAAIMGSIDINSSPANAEITLDGKVIGTTPMFLPEYIIGPHTLKIAKAGYGTYNEEITLAEGETKTISPTLSSGRAITITCATAGSRIYVDGQDMGAAPFEGTLSYGSHSVYAMDGAKKTAVKTVNVTEGAGAMADVSLSFIEKEIQITVKGVTFEMVYVPGGTFTMGATAEQGSDAWPWEKPAHSVTLSGYYIGKYEVTQAQWKAIMGKNPSRFKGDNLPVERVSWDDCQKFIEKLNKLTGKKFSLPTEAQWEYAARGGKSGGTKYSGSDDIDNVAWYGDNRDETHPVGTKSPNDLGIYDMSGNVEEWCQDWYDCNYYKNSPTSNPIGPGSGSGRVYRGGSWNNSAGFCRVSDRYGYTPDCRLSILGFRLCLSIR